MGTKSLFVFCICSFLSQKSHTIFDVSVRYGYYYLIHSYVSISVCWDRNIIIRHAHTVTTSTGRVHRDWWSQFLEVGQTIQSDFMKYARTYVAYRVFNCTFVRWRVQYDLGFAVHITQNILNQTYRIYYQTISTYIQY